MDGEVMGGLVRLFLPVFQRHTVLDSHSLHFTEPQSLPHHSRSSPSTLTSIQTLRYDIDRDQPKGMKLLLQSTDIVTASCRLLKYINSGIEIRSLHTVALSILA